MISYSPRMIIIFIITLVLSACTSLAVDAPFVADPAKRKQFVESIEIGKTTISDLTQRWGSVTSAGTAESGNRPDTNYNWATGYTTNGTGAYITVRASHEGVVKTVKSEGPNGPDNFNTNSTVSNTLSEQSKVKNVSVAQKIASGNGVVTYEMAKEMVNFRSTNIRTGTALKAKFGNPDYVEIDKPKWALDLSDQIDVLRWGPEPGRNQCGSKPFVLAHIYQKTDEIRDVWTNYPGIRGYGC